MAKNLKAYGISVSYNLDSNDPAEDHIIVTLKKRVTDGDDEVVGTRTYKPSDWGPTCQRRNTLYGASKVLQDRTSDLSGEESRLDSMDEVASRLEADHWEKEREAAGPTVRIEVEALAEIKGVKVAAIQKALRDYDAEARERILSSAAVQAKVQEMQAASSDSDLSLDDLAA
jgi:hypothetical protein